MANLAAGGTFFGSKALAVVGFSSGAKVGLASGFAGGFTGSALTTWTGGGSFIDGLSNGFRAGVQGALIGAAVGGVTGGIRANKEGLNFWDGKPIDEVGGDEIFGKVKYKFLDEEIPAGHSPTETGEIAQTSSNPKYGDYGYTRNEGTKAHRGLDFLGKEGDPVYAMHDGSVDVIGGSKAFGPYRVRIKVYLNGKTYYNNYGHLSKNLVNFGNKVVAGQQIGIMGRLGNLANSTFPTHVHVSFHRIISSSPLTFGYVYPSFSLK